MRMPLLGPFLAVSLIPFMLLFATASYGQCPAGTASGDTIVCADNDPDGVDALDGDDVVTVDPGVTVGGPITLGAGTDTATNNGVITTSNDDADAISDVGGDGTISNAGSIQTGGVDADGLYGDGDNYELTNESGADITVTGFNSDGLEVDNSSDSTVINAGDITTMSEDGDGIDIDGGSGNTGTNSGTIVTNGDDSDGIENTGDMNTITNSGSIVTHGSQGSTDTADASFSGANGIETDGNLNEITNSGSITTTGAGSDGIVLRGLMSSVMNTATGTIAVDTASGSICINSQSAQQSDVTNNGTINCAGGTAVFTGDQGNSLSLGTDSETNGDVMLNDGNDSLDATGNAVVNGGLDGGPATDSLVLDGASGETGMVNGDITRFESLDKNGAGTWTLNGDADVGQANLNNGTLALAGGTLDGDATVDDGATFDVQNAAVTGNVDNSGVLDSNAGQFQIDGNYIQNASGELQVQVANPGGPDTDIHADGTATLDGTVTVDYLGAPQNVAFGDTTLPLVTADGGRSAEFASENIDGDIQGQQFNSLYTSQVIYNDEQARLQINRASQFGTNLDLNRVQEATAGAFDDATANGDVSSELAQIIADVNNLNTSGQLQALQTGGLGTHDELARVSRFLTRQVQSTLDSRLRRLCSAADPRQRDERRKSCSEEGLWVNAYGQNLDQDPDGEGFLGFDADTDGAAIGNDWAAGNGYLGFSAGLAEADVDFNRNGGDGDINSYYMAGYGGVGGDAWYADANLVFARHEYNQARNIVIGGTGSTARSEHDADEYAANAEAGYDWIQRDNWRLTPFVALEYSLLDEEGFNESGAGALNQNVESRETDSLRSDLGLRLSSAYAVGAGNRLSAWASAAWSHDYGIDDRTVAASLAGAPNTRFSVDGRDLDKNGAKTELGVGYGDGNSYRISLRAQGEFRGNLERVGGLLQFTKLYD